MENNRVKYLIKATALKKKYEFYIVDTIPASKEFPTVDDIYENNNGYSIMEVDRYYEDPDEIINLEEKDYFITGVEI